MAKINDDIPDFAESNDAMQFPYGPPPGYDAPPIPFPYGIQPGSDFGSWSDDNKGTRRWIR